MWVVEVRFSYVSSALGGSDCYASRPGRFIPEEPRVSVVYGTDLPVPSVRVLRVTDLTV
jgi:hypothetical protein